MNYKLIFENLILKYNQYINSTKLTEKNQIIQSIINIEGENFYDKNSKINIIKILFWPGVF